MRWGLIAALALSASSAAGAAQKEKGPAGWLTDYEKARTVARKTGKPLFVVFRCQP
jgi:hypothetical protein